MRFETAEPPFNHNIVRPEGLAIHALVLWETDGLSVGELGEKLRLDTGTLTPVLKRMADQGFVSRVRSRGDERVVLVELTKKGWALQETARDILHRVGACLPFS